MVRRFYRPVIFAACLICNWLAAESVDRISLDRIANYYAAKCQYAEDRQSGKIIGKNFCLECYANNACYRINGINVYGQWPVLFRGNELLIAKHDGEKTFVPIVSPRIKPTVRRICIDAGHGGRDRGTQNSVLRLAEKAMTLDMALRLKKALTRRGFDVILTRRDDVYLTLPSRTERSNRNHCDLFICLHFNAAEAKEANGIETYILSAQGDAPTARLNQIRPRDLQFFPNNRYDAQNLNLAFHIQKSLIERMRVRDRGIKRGRFKVLENLNCPGVLIECGFLTNPRESQQISQAEFRSRMAESIADGIQLYVDH